MKFGIIALAALVAVGFVAVDAVVENLGGEGVVTTTASAHCIEVDGGCLSACVPPPEPLHWECTM